FFDNTIVLLILFAMVIAAGVYMSRRNQASPSEQLADVERQLQSAPGPGWLNARDEILLPLLKSDRLPDRRGDMETWVRKIDQYEFCRSLSPGASSRQSGEEEIFRLVRRAFERSRQGHSVEAQEELTSVLTITDGNPQYAYLTEFLRKSVADWDKDGLTAERRELVAEIVKRANSLTDTNQNAAVELLKSVVRLYADDASVTDLVDQSREMLLRFRPE
ncbi:MAG: hypothetical protein KDA89_04135, partial [Planctomycetaceae bacterium]|nr:hypothetical protein [Planctomycetaceae bacterium]